MILANAAVVVKGRREGISKAISMKLKNRLMGTSSRNRAEVVAENHTPHFLH
jgi:hypothetical protein